MPEVIFTGPGGRIEGRFHPAKQKNAPIAIILHPHPQFGGTMNHQIIYQLYYAFVHRNFSVLRFNFRGVGRSQGSFDHGQGELSDAASALDWAQSINPEARSCWIAGVSFRLALPGWPRVRLLRPAVSPRKRRSFTTASACRRHGRRASPMYRRLLSCRLI